MFETVVVRALVEAPIAAPAPVFNATLDAFWSKTFADLLANLSATTAPPFYAANPRPAPAPPAIAPQAKAVPTPSSAGFPSIAFVIIFWPPFRIDPEPAMIAAWAPIFTP